MIRSRAQLALPVTLLVTAIVAMLPAGWRLEWSKDLGALVRFPLRPFTHAGTALAGWLRPPPPPGGDAAVGPEVAELREDRDLARRLYLSERERVLELEEQIRELQQIPAATRRWSRANVIAYVTMRSPSSALGTVELKLEPGVDVPVDGRTIAVYRSVHLLGRITGERSGSVCELMPLVNPASRNIRAAIFPREDPLLSPDVAPNFSLLPVGDGTLSGAIDRAIPVARGDLVRLVDPGWPRTAQMMVLGEVDSIDVNDEEPLRNTITVRPRYQVQEVTSVVLIVEDESAPPTSPAPSSPSAAETAP